MTIRVFFFFLSFPFYSNIAAVGRSIVDYNRCPVPPGNNNEQDIQGFRHVKKTIFNEDTVLF